MNEQRWEREERQENKGGFNKRKGDNKFVKTVISEGIVSLGFDFTALGRTIEETIYYQDVFPL